MYADDTSLQVLSGKDTHSTHTVVKECIKIFVCFLLFGSNQTNFY